MHIGTRLRELREDRDLSQDDIEKRTGLLCCYVSRAECGHTLPEVTTLKKWAKALDLELYQIFYQGEGKPVAPKVAELGSTLISSEQPTPLYPTAVSLTRQRVILP